MLTEVERNMTLWQRCAAFLGRRGDADDVDVLKLHVYVLRERADAARVASGAR